MILNAIPIRCDECKPPKDTPEPHLCGQAPCPGNEIILCPPFGVLDIKSKHRKGRPKSSCPPGPTILHEAAHNAGACSDIKSGAPNYPPSNAEDNAYSYENYAVAVAAGAHKGKGKKKGSRKP